MTHIEKAVVLAAGRGTRMRELTNDVPKPMIEVRGKPVLQHIVEGLRDAGIRDCLIVVGYRAMLCRIFLATVRATTSQFSIKRKRCKMGRGALWSSLTILSQIVHSSWPMATF